MVVYKSDALVDNRVKIIYKLDPALYTKVEYPITILNNKNDTLHLYNFLMKDKVLSIFRNGAYCNP